MTWSLIITNLKALSSFSEQTIHESWVRILSYESKSIERFRNASKRLLRFLTASAVWNFAIHYKFETKDDCRWTTSLWSYNKLKTFDEIELNSVSQTAQENGKLQSSLPSSYLVNFYNNLLYKHNLDGCFQAAVRLTIQRFWRNYSLPGSNHSSWHLRIFVECNPHTEKAIAPKLLCCTYITTFSSQWTTERAQYWSALTSAPHSTWSTMTGWYSGCRIVSDWLVLRLRGSSPTCRTESSSSRSETTLPEQLDWNQEFLKVRY